jgi:VTC domain
MISHLAANRGSEPETPGALAVLREVGTELAAARALLTRVDRKYLLPREALDALLFSLRDDYGVLRAGTRLDARYSTRYFDTSDLRMYDDHRRGRCPRYKVRVRHHIDRSLSFLEVKRKGTNQQTTKAILNRPFGVAELDPEARHFIDQHCPIAAASLASGVSIDFRRVTLVGDIVNERVTIDWGFDFHEVSAAARFAHALIVEVKQARYSNHTPAIRALRAFRIREQSISKYCIATAAVAAVRSNTFKSALRAVERLSDYE